MRIPMSCLCLALCTAVATAQVVAPAEISDPSLRLLQVSVMPQLKLVAKSVTSHKFDYNFYLTRKLDIDEKKQKTSDQHSIRFEHYNGMTVLAISGNYYGAYPINRFSEAQRARRTFFSVILPLAKASVPMLEDNLAVQGFAFEVSHHVIGRAMGLAVERPENLMVYLPRVAAIKLVTASDRTSQQAALLDAQVFLNAAPLDLWLADEGGPSRSEVANSQPVPLKQTSLAGEISIAPVTIPLPDAPEAAVVLPTAAARSTTVPAVVAAPLTAPAPDATTPIAIVTPRDLSPQALASLQSANQAVNNHLVKDLAHEAHLVAYAPPAFIAFRNQAYLELSLSTTLSESARSSRYKLAALTFDEQISPLIRRVLPYFPRQADFDGISFSSTVQTKTKPGVHASAPISIEFFFSLGAMRQYESFELTGQGLLNCGIILINGERVEVDLQLAEGDSRF